MDPADDHRLQEFSQRLERARRRLTGIRQNLGTTYERLKRMSGRREPPEPDR
jgi:hypothetical protein